MAAATAWRRCDISRGSIASPPFESFNGKFRDECLNEHWFTTLAHARAVIAAWRRDYNETRPHQALNDLTPGEFARQHSLRPAAEGS